MSPEKRKDLRQKLANLSEAEKQALIDRGIVATVEGRALSEHNVILAYMQHPNPTVVAGYRQWQAAGRQVCKGQHGIGIWAPSVRRARDEDAGIDDEDLGFYFVTVFDISQTEPIEQAVAA